jgi:hypothetical protein
MGGVLLSYGWKTERESEEQGTQVLHLDVLLGQNFSVD